MTRVEEASAPGKARRPAGEIEGMKHDEHSKQVCLTPPSPPASGYEGTRGPREEQDPPNRSNQVSQ